MVAVTALAMLCGALVGFGIWLVIGLVLYFAYGYNHSKLRVRAHR